jgi:hypothetical protein
VQYTRTFCPAAYINCIFQPTSTVFVSVSMTADKSVFRGENFAGASGSCSLVKGVFESRWTGQGGKSDSNERRRDQLGGRVQEADEEIQSGGILAALTSRHGKVARF